MATINLLSTRALSKSFAGLQAVKHVNFSLPEGQIRALIGPNGAGKSTFVGMLCGRIPSTSGSISFDGRNITDFPAHRRMALGMAYTFQITSIFSQLPVYENIALAARREPNLNSAAVQTRVEKSLMRVNLDKRADTMAGELSYGHQRLLEIAMGLAQSPRLFILDEPTQGLAENEIAGFKTLIRELSADTTILLIEHNMDVVMDTADVITVLNFGEILAEGPPAEIRANQAVQAAYLGTS